MASECADVVYRRSIECTERIAGEVLRKVLKGAEVDLLALAAGKGIEPVRPCITGNRAMPGVTDAEVAGEVVVDRDVFGGVVAHRDDPKITSDLVLGVAALDECLDESTHWCIAVAATDLCLDPNLGVVGIELLLQTPLQDG